MDRRAERIILDSHLFVPGIRSLVGATTRVSVATSRQSVSKTIGAGIKLSKGEVAYNFECGLR